MRQPRARRGKGHGRGGDPCHGGDYTAEIGEGKRKLTMRRGRLGRHRAATRRLWHCGLAWGTASNGLHVVSGAAIEKSILAKRNCKGTGST